MFDSVTHIYAGQLTILYSKFITATWGFRDKPNSTEIINLQIY